MHLDPRRVHVVYEAAAPSFKRVSPTRPSSIAFVARYGLTERIILYVGTIEPRKNLPRLIDAFAARRRTGRSRHQLVCVGPYGWLSRGIEDLIARSTVADAINFTGYVPFEDLPALYSLAEDVRVSVDVRRLRFAGHRGDGVRDAGRHRTRGRVVARSAATRSSRSTRSMPDALGRRAGLADRAAAIAARNCRPPGWRRARTFSWIAPHARVSTSTRRGLTATSAPRPPGVSAQRVRLPQSCVQRRVDVLFGQAYFLRFDPKLWEARQPYAPLGALYAAACVRERGYRVALFDAMLAESEPEWAAALDRASHRASR